ncbi:MAG: 4Fe-4S dicluster domain-containing protein [Desulfobacteraceae bacterium]|nr:MAG: 4Fe-4S dicluster domain-containing protein [Desulfobacteraceae bacterium]
MKEPFLSLAGKMKFFSKAKEPYKNLRKHFNAQAVGYPATLTGIELRLLREIFTVMEAEAALVLTYRFETFESLYPRAQEKGLSADAFRKLLESMEKKGGIFVKHQDGEIYYALHPFAIGMFEMQISRLSPSFFMDSHNYMLQGFAMEYLTTEVPQMRVIPVNKSLKPMQNVATYDQIREIVESTKDKIGVNRCICKTGRDLINDPCKVTDRREVCIGFRDFYDTYSRQGWGRAVSKEEALEILDQNEKDGLLLIGSTMQEPQFVCSCCACCCGIMEMLKFMPRPADFSASNFYAKLEPATCNGCGKCISRCQMEAISFKSVEKKKMATAIDPKRCIGCGLCVASCKTGAISLRKKEIEFIPPKDHVELYETIMQKKKGLAGKIGMMTKAMMGMKV